MKKRRICRRNYPDSEEEDDLSNCLNTEELQKAIYSSFKLSEQQKLEQINEVIKMSIMTNVDGDARDAHTPLTCLSKSKIKNGYISKMDM